MMSVLRCACCGKVLDWTPEFGELDSWLGSHGASLAKAWCSAECQARDQERSS